MANIKLDYGKHGMEIEIPDAYNPNILRMKETLPVENPAGVMAEKLSSPLGTDSFESLCDGAKTACILVSDKTRPAPNRLMLPPLLKILDRHSVGITILIACGTHSPTEGTDLKYVLGKDIPEKYKVINHDAYEKENLAFVGENASGVPFLVNRNYCEADLKILTGFIEPHFMAGFSGGRKAVCPGIAGIETIRYMHSPAVLESPLAKSGVLEGNPCSEFALEAAEAAGCDFLVNVTLDAGKRITGIFCGDLRTAYAEGVRFCEEQVAAYIDRPLDVVVTTNGGYPLDRDFYQTVKGIVGALNVIKDGGAIIIASECSDGIGSDEFREQLFNMTDPDEFMGMISREEYFRVDQWEVEELIRALRRCRIKVCSQGLTPEEIRKCRCEPVSDINREILETINGYGKGAEIGIIPAGPYVLARLRK